MPLLPQSRADQITFFETHLPLWQADPASIGLSPAQVAGLAAQIASARAALTAADIQRIESMSATQNFHLETDGMTGTGTDLIRLIRAHAAITNDPDVYVRSGLPAPASGSPLPAPATPRNFQVTLQPTGAILLKWKCPQPRGAMGTLYEIARRIGPSSSTNRSALIATVGRREFLDDSIPASAGAGGADGITYTVTAVRSTKRGAPSQFRIFVGNSQVTSAVSYSPYSDAA